MNRHLPRLLLATTSVGLLVAACGSSGSPSGAQGSTAPSAAEDSMSMPADSASAPASVAGAEPTVHIKGFMFSDPSSPVSAGQKFMVVNDDSVAHTYETVKKEGGFDSGNIPAHGSKEITASAAGSYQLKCDYHPSMKGTLTVG